MAFGLTAFAEAPFASLTASENAGVIVTGLALSSNLGTTAQVGTGNVSLTGQLIASNLGTAIGRAGADVPVTGDLLNSNLGIVDPSPDATVTGLGMTAALAVGTVFVGNANVSLTGQLATATLDSVTARANADVSVTGNILDSNLGIVDPAPDATVTGIEMTAALAVGTVVVGTANVPVTGQLATLTLNSATAKADANVPVTGQTITSTLGQAGIRWAIVPTGDDTTWTPVSEGSSSTWTEVNQGSSSTWKEVA